MMPSMHAGSVCVFGGSYSAGIFKLTTRGIALIYFPLICFFYIVWFVLPSKLSL